MNEIIFLISILNTLKCLRIETHEYPCLIRLLECIEQCLKILVMRMYVFFAYSNTFQTLHCFPYNNHFSRLYCSVVYYTSRSVAYFQIKNTNGLLEYFTNNFLFLNLKYKLHIHIFLVILKLTHNN